MANSMDPKKALTVTELSKKKSEYLKYDSSPEKLTWCSGCGDYGIQKAMERALVLEGLKPQDLLWCFDIGCHGNGSDKISGVTTLHGLHGRVLPAAAGAAIANTNLKVIAEAGDGGTFSEGVNHLVHAVRSDYPVTFILHNNENYGLTIGQASSTTRCGQAMAGSPDGPLSEPMNTCAFVLGLNPSFVARTFSGDVEQMTTIFRAALKHKGFAYVEVMQLCPTFNKATSQTWYLDRIRYTTDIKGYDKSNLEQAKKAAQDLDKEIMMGILYENPKMKPFMDRLKSREGKKTTLVQEVDHFDVRSFLKQFE